MILADVNVHLGAYRPDSPIHAVCRTWLTNLVESGTMFGVSPQVLSGVIRIATNKRAFEPPSPTADVIGYCEDLLSHPRCVVLQPGQRHWGIFARLCREVNAKANLVQDVWFAALAIEHGCEWITLDRDFARFPGLRWRLPS